MDRARRSETNPQRVVSASCSCHCLLRRYNALDLSAPDAKDRGHGSARRAATWSTMYLVVFPEYSLHGCRWT